MLANDEYELDIPTLHIYTMRDKTIQEQLEDLFKQLKNCPEIAKKYIPLIQKELDSVIPF